MRRRLFLLFIALHALVLVGWVVSLEWAVARGATIRVAVAQRDPRDLLRGDYVWLQFAFSEIPPSAFAAPARPNADDRVWVALAPHEGVWELTGASLTREALPLTPGARILVGRVDYPLVQVPEPTGGRPQAVHVVYGIERYYVPEGKGTPPRGQKLEAELALTADGRPFLRRLFVDGRPYP